MWIALNIIFYHTYHITRNNHNSISSWRRNRKKIQANGAIYFFSFFLSSKKKNSPVHRSWGKIVQWKSKRIRDVSHCLELAFVIRSEEKSALRRRLDRNCTNANRFEQKTVRKYGPIVTRISEILPCCFSVFLESQNFHRINSRSIVIVREILEFLRRREESFWKIYPFWTRSNASISDRISRSWNFFFKFLLDKIKMEQGQPDLADKFTEFQGREGHSCIHLAIVSTCISFISFERIILPRTTAIFSSQDARRMSWLSFAMKTRDGYTWVMGGKVEQSIKKESWEGEGNKGKKWSRWLRSFLAKWGITLSCFSLF